MKPKSFVSTVGEISADLVPDIPGLEPALSHWTQEAFSAEEWFREANAGWGTAGFAVRRGDETSGFVLYAPARLLPRAGAYPLGTLGEDGVLLACVTGDARTRRRLLVRMLRDLKQRGVARVEAIASDRGAPHHAPTPFLLESGWKPVRRAWYRGSPYTLARTDLGSAVEVGELARGLLGRVKLPHLKAPNPAPGILVSTLPGFARQLVSTLRLRQAPFSKSSLAVARHTIRAAARGGSGKVRTEKT